DTIWIPTEEDGLVARDIYTGTVIVSSAQLSQKFPELAKGISKAEKEWGKKVFKLSTADGFEYYFSPVTNSIYKKSELEHQLKSNGSPRTFFILADGKRPLLYKSIEKRNPLYRLSDVSSYDLEHYNNKGNNFRKSSAVISIKELNPDKPYFNGIIAYSDEKKVIILYQPENSKKSEMIVSCLDADGHELWNIKGKDTEDFRTVFADSNRAIDFSSSSSTLILYFRRANCIAMGIDVNTGAIKWKYSNAL
ncbi:MAG TPA: hypothetical protein VNX68_03690, partial [Nitrosopumilaceae archaeon]|nr:hypothetical protein [Nitrosopumilaceae archaeon]